MFSLPPNSASAPPHPSGWGSSSGLLLNAQPASDEKGKGREQDEGPEVDGGDVIGRKAKSLPPPSDASAQRDDSERAAVESILSAFRLGRPLKEPLPLGLVVRPLKRAL